MASRVMEFSIPFYGSGFEKQGELYYSFDNNTIVFKKVHSIEGSKLIYTTVSTIMDRKQFEKGVDKLKDSVYVCFGNHNDDITMSADVKIKVNDGKREIVVDINMYHLNGNLSNSFTVTADKFDTMVGEITRNQRIMDNEIDEEV